MFEELFMIELLIHLLYSYELFKSIYYLSIYLFYIHNEMRNLFLMFD